MASPSPASGGFRMPAEFAPHERCLICWPTRSRAYWGDYYMLAQATYAAVARAIAAFEPVLVIADARRGRRRARLLRLGEHRGRRAAHRRLLDPRQRAHLPARSSRRARRGRLPLQLLGRAVPPLRQGRRDRRSSLRASRRAALRRRRWCSRGARSRSTARALSSPPRAACSTRTRNPTLSKDQIEQGLKDFLGVEKVIWLKSGLGLDEDPRHRRTRRRRGRLHRPGASPALHGPRQIASRLSTTFWRTGAGSRRPMRAGDRSRSSSSICAAAPRWSAAEQSARTTSTSTRPTAD